jgi:ABC-type phosphate transport system auxiliary subunit
MRSYMGIVTQTVARLTKQLAPLKAQAESIAKQLKAAQDQYDKAVAVKGADVGAANQILEATKRRLGRVEKVLDGQLRDLQIDYLKARNAFEFSAQASEDIADAIEANTKTFSQPEYDARKEYVTAKRNLLFIV